MSHSQQQRRCFVLRRRHRLLQPFRIRGLRAIFCRASRRGCTGARRALRRGILALTSLMVMLPLDGQFPRSLSLVRHNGLVLCGKFENRDSGLSRWWRFHRGLGWIGSWASQRLDKDEQKCQSNGTNTKKRVQTRTLLRSATRFDSGVCFSSARRAISTRTAWRGGGTFQFVCCSFL